MNPSTPPTTPERVCHSQREQDRLQHLQMTSPSHHHGRSSHPGPDPNIRLPCFHIPLETHIPSQLDRPCDHPMPVVPAMPIVPAIAPRGGHHGRPCGSGHGGAPGGQPSLHGAVPAVPTVQNHLHGQGHGCGRGAVQVIHPQPVSPPDIDMRAVSPPPLLPPSPSPPPPPPPPPPAPPSPPPIPPPSPPPPAPPP
ncbi:hypothetical protein EDD18DRAFT_1381470 [Armillaria luteobubalina]|uniref:Uncharacterized protein n=1 Tax=Armillaria luteobubalina TaxID=153913 RepID=A0AA39Q7W8_9AGAR|nr:hypothetical protein EDD18DRAFT_1381470 [Armillaria luteobubalina]